MTQENTETGILLEKILPKERIKARLIDLVAYAADAGFYYLRPQAVVQPVSEEEIKSLFAFSHQHKIPLTFRTAGTSLSGQSITDGILVDLSQHWRGIAIEDEGRLVKVKPGITGAMVNAKLKPFRKKIGPDPSSISAAMMGGILSNNSSGMCCGVHLNSYHTTKCIRFILPNGKTFSTAEPEDYSRFETECDAIFTSIQNYRNSIAENASLHDRIRQKYLTKNTTGYSLNAFIDYQHPLDIFAHLLIGAEGTLGFIAEATLQTIPDYPFKSTGLLYFPDIYAACQAIVPLINAQAEAVELMDRASLKSIEHIDGVPEILKTLSPASSALLIEFQGNTKEEVETKRNAFLDSSHNLSLSGLPEFTEDKKEQAFLWKIRKGMFPAVGAVRARGTTVILEDVAFPVAKLGDAIIDLQKLFKKYEYHDAIIFGHAKDGNIHFVITQTFNAESEVQRYARFIDEMVTLVVKKYDGALKAEHGTGRNMAPFVETEWGSEAYSIMKGIKEIVDPQNLLNPGVLINNNKDGHLLNLKPLPVVEEEVDKCIECGYCEHVCPSRDLTLTPRQRIVVRREMELLRSEGKDHLRNQLLKQYEYDGLETCAVDGMCSLACPVDINTGDLVKKLRAEEHTDSNNSKAVWVAKHFSSTISLVRFALKSGTVVNSLFGKNAMTNITGTFKKLIPGFPKWSVHLAPAPLSKAPQDRIYNNNPGKTIIYFPTCISRMMGGNKNGKKDIFNVFLRVSQKAGIQVRLPENIQHLCCGQMFSSKGYKDAFKYMANKTVEALWLATEEGKLPVVIDVTSCTLTLLHCAASLTDANRKKFDNLIILDSVQYVEQYIVPGIKITSKKQQVTLHPVCSTYKMKAEDQLEKLASHFANHVYIPDYAGCCGMAGDRGFLFPELTGAATKMEAKEVKQNCDGYYSTSKPCEIAMSEATGKNYESILYLVDETTE